MNLASIVNKYYDSWIEKYGKTALPGHLKAFNSILRCRTSASGQVYISCPDCNYSEWRPVSCGHRSCPQCQNHESTKWIERQQNKLLPVQYYMVTFTLPYELRKLVWQNQRVLFSALFKCVSGTLKDFGINPKHLGAEMGMTLMLHTHSRKLDFHPHIHAVVPGGGIDKKRGQWKKKKGKYLFNEDSMAKVFRARFLDELNNLKLKIPRGIISEWVVDCTRVGKGLSAVKYLSKYLYRGVISDKNIISDKNGFITFRYTESKTGKTKYKTLKGKDFLQLIIQHVLPSGFRRVRDYGFLHSNAKKLLLLVQLVLHVKIMDFEPSPAPEFKCPRCKASMNIVGFCMKLKGPG